MGALRINGGQHLVIDSKRITAADARDEYLRHPARAGGSDDPH